MMGNWHKAVLLLAFLAIILSFFYMYVHSYSSTVEGNSQSQSAYLHYSHRVDNQSTSQDTSPQRILLQNVTKFCDSFMLTTYSKPVSVCDRSVECYGSIFTSKMIKCTFRNILLQPPQGQYEGYSHWFNILNRDRNSSDLCPNHTLQSLSEAMRNVNYMKGIVKHILKDSPANSSKCLSLEKKVVFFFVGSSNICLHFLNYYSLYKSIEDSGLSKGEYAIVKISKLKNFEVFEKTLFPEVQRISHYFTPTCIKRAIFVPYYYYTVPFKCKMEGNLLPYCTQCTGERYSKSYTLFRTKVLQSCGLSDSTEGERREKRIVFLSRKPIDRKLPTARIVANEKELIEAVNREFPSANLSVVHMEDLDICQQIEVAHKADVLMGPHGAGMIHLWWMQDSAVVLEFEPDYKSHQPTFRVLSSLMGRKYKKVKLYKTPIISHDRHLFRVNVDEVIAELKTS